jgi:phosphoribosylformylglycinamidine synthase
MAYGIPLLSGKDSMYVDGHLAGPYGESHKVSALETLQFSATSLVENVRECVSMDPKMAGDLVYVLGLTKNELGASEYYEHLGYTGTRVPEVDMAANTKLYGALHQAISKGLVASAHGIYRGGLGFTWPWRPWAAAWASMSICRPCLLTGRTGTISDCSRNPPDGLS